MNDLVTVKDLLHILPIAFVALWGCLVLLADALGRSRSAQLGPLAILGLLFALGVCVWAWIAHPTPARDVFGGMIVMDRYGLFFDMLFIVAGIITLLLASPYQRAHGFAFGEHHSLLLLIITGMMLLIHAGDFVVLVIGLETMSIGIYALVASWEGNAKSAEGGLKYYVMGAVASAFLLYGIALIYGSTGQTNLAAVGAAAPGMVGNMVFLLGMFMVLVALAFKVALVPFHGWTPDAYEGAPTTVTGFMAAAVKAAGFGVLLRVFLGSFGDSTYVFGHAGWADIFQWLAILTMILGNLAALRQSNIKRMLAYSSIAHAGYILIGVVAAGILAGEAGEARASVLYYLLAYTFTTLGAFGVVAWIGSRGDERLDIDSWAGLGTRHPVAAAAMALFLLSLAGVPPTAGFFAKFYLFRGALDHPGLIPLVIVAVLNSVVSFYYYLRPVVQMYFREASSQPGAAALPPAPLRSGGVVAALVIAVIFVLLLGLMPHDYLVWAGQAAASL